MIELDSVKIHSTGMYVPSNVTTNDDLAQWMDTSDEWIRQRTGIEQRHLSEGENTSDLCIKASQNILRETTVEPEEIGLIIVATVTPDTQTPSVAARVQSTIKAKNAIAFDLNAACTGFVYALSVADKMLKQMQSDYALVIGGEVLSKAIDWTDRRTAVLFGDGAGGVLLKKEKSSSDLFVEDLHTDGDKGEAIKIGGRKLNNPLFTSDDDDEGYMEMDGRSVFNFVTKTIPGSIEAVLNKENLEMDDIDFVLFHQANAKMIEIVAKKLNSPIEKFPMNIQKYGNTSAASIPILLDELVKNEKIKLGSKQKIILSAFGGGLTWGTVLIEL